MPATRSASATGEPLPQLSPAMIDPCGPGTSTGRPRARRRARRPRRRARHRRAPVGAARARTAAQARAPTPIWTHDGRAPRRGGELLVDLGEDRGVAVDDPAGDLVVARPRRVGHDEQRRGRGRRGGERRRRRRCRRRRCTSRPLRAMASIRASAVPAGTRMRAPRPSRRAMRATARPWLPSVAVTSAGQEPGDQRASSSKVGRRLAAGCAGSPRGTSPTTRRGS